jgi:xanthine dehydrogenase molybdopterin-binding subunit B
MGFYRTPDIYWNAEPKTGRPFYYFAYGAACSEVMIDITTGETKVLPVDILHDVSRSLNPALDRSKAVGEPPLMLTISGFAAGGDFTGHRGSTRTLRNGPHTVDGGQRHLRSE